MALGDLDKDVQAYLKALRRAGTPVSVPLVLAAATGLVIAKDRTLLRQHGSVSPSGTHNKCQLNLKLEYQLTISQLIPEC